MASSYREAEAKRDIASKTKCGVAPYNRAADQDWNYYNTTVSHASEKNVKSAKLGPLESARRLWLFIRKGVKMEREKGLGGSKGVKRRYKG